MLQGAEGASLGPDVSIELAAALVASSAFSIPAVRLLGNRLIKPGKRFDVDGVRWGGRDLLMVLAAWCATVLVVASLPVHGFLMSLFLTAVSFAIAGVYGVFLGTAAGGAESLRAMGFGLTGNERAAIFGALSYFALAPALYGVLILWLAIADALGLELGAQAVLVGFDGLRGPDRWLAIVLAVVVVPFVEELLFRGFLQPLCIRRLGTGAGIAVTALVFGVAHGTTASVPIFALALALGWIQLRSGRLAGAWIAHGLHNALTLAITFAYW